jgi:hypothetical protein
MPADSLVTAQYLRTSFGCDAYPLSISLSLFTPRIYTLICHRQPGMRILGLGMLFLSINKLHINGHTQTY